MNTTKKKTKTQTRKFTRIITVLPQTMTRHQMMSPMKMMDDYKGFSFIQEIVCNMNGKARIPDSWILLDSHSMVDIFMNKKLLKNICDMKKTLSLHFNAGINAVEKVGYLPGYSTVWFYEDGIANILSLNNAKKKYHVTYASTACDCFELHKADGT